MEHDPVRRSLLKYLLVLAIPSCGYAERLNDAVFGNPPLEEQVVTYLEEAKGYTDRKHLKVFYDDHGPKLDTIISKFNQHLPLLENSFKSLEQDSLPESYWSPVALDEIDPLYEKIRDDLDNSFDALQFKGKDARQDLRDARRSYRLITLEIMTSRILMHELMFAEAELLFNYALKQEKTPETEALASTALTWMHPMEDYAGKSRHAEFRPYGGRLRRYRRRFDFEFGTKHLNSPSEPPA